MPAKEIFRAVKDATVAIVHMEPSGTSPFTIVGSGFCIDRCGIIATCQHVISAFMSETVPQQVKETPKDDRFHPLPFKLQRRPFALFYCCGDAPTKLFVAVSAIDQMMARIDRDIGLVRACPHQVYASGFPTVEIAEFSELHEGMEVATCGFPLGNFLRDQIGTTTSSITRGALSSIIPTPYVKQNDVRGLQLDLRATHGNSGGPVFAVESGKVFGVLSSGIVTKDGYNLAIAEPIYPIISKGEIDLLRNAPLGAMPSEQTIRAAIQPTE
jgi:S1-C subfamily serine protease